MEFIVIIAILIMSVVIHEVSHGVAALGLGDSTAKYQGRLTLNPFSHLDPIGSVIVPMIGYLLGGFIIGWAKPVPFNPYNLRNQKWGEAIVAAAGPISNIFIAIVFGLFIRLGTQTFNLNETFISLASFVVIINITLAIFNLVPIPPLDGSKILFSLLPHHMQSIRHSIEKYGLILVIIFVSIIWRVLNPFIFYLFNLLTGLS